MKVFLRTGLLSALFLVMSLTPVLVFSGNIHLKSGETKVSVTESDYTKINFRVSVSGLDFMEVKTPEGIFVNLSAYGFGNRNTAGEPALPVYHRLIEIPLGAEFTYRIKKQHVTVIDLKQTGIRYPVFPAQPPMSKSDDPENIPFVINKALYNTDRFIGDGLVTASHAGLLRSLNLARVDISPVQYNPVTNELKIYDELEIEIIFENADVAATIALKQAKASPYFRSMYQTVVNYKPLDPTDELITNAPATYVIVSDPMFQAALQPFIQWKTKKGFKVIEGYTNNPAVGTTTTSIKSYLQGLYNSPPAGYSAPSFVLLVGDVAQIPAWAGTAGSHVTDLRYCEYTGDNLPEVYYGRFSATNLAQLQPQIDKTLEYEQYLMPDPSFLGEVVMAAGADSGHETWSNGQINYGTETYFNAAHNILSHTYLQPEPSGGNYSENIQANVSNGVAYANYTAHCSSSGWADPGFTISDIPSLTNAHKYSLMVGNCCLSAKFDVTSFAEEILRAENKGAVGYIGGSNSTYWDEDYWWGVGYKTVALHPAYNAAHIGGYDGAFHDHGEPTSDWFVTQGQMVVCGNYAVEESSSSLKTYYWEIYHLMGDPSLMIYYSVPQALTATYQSTLMIGMTSLTVNTEAYATVALSNGGVLLDAKVADAGGLVNLSFTALSAPGNLDIVITKQNRQPLIGIIQVIPADGPYVVYTGNTINDPVPGGNNNGTMDYEETNLVSVALKNVGVETAVNVVATLSSSNPYVTITDNSAPYGNIAPNQTVTISDGFALNVANNIPDQHIVSFAVSATDGTDTWNSNFNITANAPVPVIGAMTVLDNGPGCNNDGILDPGETADLVFACSNTGHSPVSGVFAALAISGGTSPYLTLNSNTYAVGSLAAGASGDAIFNVTADAATPLGTPVDLLVELVAGNSGQFTDQETRQIVIGLIPVFNMSNTAVTTCTGFFYDSGGASGAYQNGENYTMTFYPAAAGSMVRMTFNSFATESGWDFLRIYNGTSTSATLIGAYNGATGPGTVTASNASGALTFNFTSDGSVTPAGWEAAISCYNTNVPPVAAFAASAISPAILSTVTFTDQSENIPTAWAWSFSPNTVTFVNGTSAASQNPQVQFTALGQYTVTLTATNAYGSDSEVKTNYINVVEVEYCIPAYTTGTSAGDYITLVQLGSINNATGASSSPYYTYYSNLSTDLTPGSAYTITLSPGTYGSGNYIAVWIDFNRNSVFDTAEKLGTISISPTPATGTIPFTVPADAAAGLTRMRVREVWNNSNFDACTTYSYGETEDYNVNILSLNRTLNLTVLLESLYNGSGTMRKAQGESGDQFPGNTADQVSIELHNASDYSIIEHTDPFVNVSTEGHASITIPGTRNGNYYITVKHRNSIETTSRQPVAFTSSLISYNFDGMTQAYGNNMLLMTDGHCTIYCGDVNQDGSVDTGDLTLVDNDSASYLSGYLVSDVNGDGLTDTADMTIVDNNAAGYVRSVTP
ncbi:MAG: C25 family cysteine peptidase [Lentimicrobium sp.]